MRGVGRLSPRTVAAMPMSRGPLGAQNSPVLLMSSDCTTLPPWAPVAPYTVTSFGEDMACLVPSAAQNQCACGVGPIEDEASGCNSERRRNISFSVDQDRKGMGRSTLDEGIPSHSEYIALGTRKATTGLPNSDCHRFHHPRLTLWTSWCHRSQEEVMVLVDRIDDSIVLQGM